MGNSTRSREESWGKSAAVGHLYALEYKRQRVRHRLEETKKTNEWRWRKGNAREGYVTLQWTPYQFKVFCITSLRRLRTWKITFVRYFSNSLSLSSCLSSSFALIFHAISLFKFLLLLFCKVMPTHVYLEKMSLLEERNKTGSRDLKGVLVVYISVTDIL